MRRCLFLDQLDFLTLEAHYYHKKELNLRGQTTTHHSERKAVSLESDIDVYRLKNIFLNKEAQIGLKYIFKQRGSDWFVNVPLINFLSNLCIFHSFVFVYFW